MVNTRHSRRTLLRTLIVGAAGALALPVSWLARRSGSTVTPEARLQRGLLLNRERKYAEAIREFTAVIRVWRDAPDAYIYRGMAEYAAGQLEPSVADFTRALVLRPAHAVVYLYRGDSYQALGKRKEAAADYTQALTRAGDDPRLAVAARVKLRGLQAGP